MTILETLRANAWFAARAPEMQDALLAAGQSVDLSAGQWVYSQGDPQAGLCAVLDGALRLEVAVDADRDVLIGLMRPPAIIGQSGRRGGGPRLVTVRASDAARVLLVPEAALARIAHDLPEVWRDVSELVYAQLDLATRLAAQLLVRPPRARIAARLLEFAVDGAARIGQGDLAEATGLSRKAVNAHLATFERAGMIRRGYRAIALDDVDRLRAVVAGKYLAAETAR